MINLKEIQQDYLAIDFFMSMSCYKYCHSCTSYTLDMWNLTVDIDFLKQTLHYLRKYKIRVFLSKEKRLLRKIKHEKYVFFVKKKNQTYGYSVYNFLPMIFFLHFALFI